MKKLSLVIIVLLLITTNIFGQDDQPGRYGKDSVQCLMNLSLYREFVKQKNYKEALPAWRKVFNECPMSTKNIYIDGVKIFGYLIQAEKDEAKKKKYVDTLMMVYDQRIQYFGDTADNYCRKAVDLLRFDNSRYEEAYTVASKAYEMLKDQTSSSTMMVLFQSSLIKFKNKKEEESQFITDFSNASSVMDAQYKSETNDKRKEQMKKLQDMMEDMFAKSGAAECETLISIYEPKFEANKDNVDFLKQVLKILDKIGCNESQLFAKSAEALYKLEPSSEAAYNLAKVFLKKEQYSKAVEYYKEAINQSDSTTSDNKADYYFELATVIGGKLGQKDAARSYAYKALALRPNWGEPYLLIGNLYAGSASDCGDDKFTQSAVYWVVVDMFVKAKSVDASCADKANKYIAKYSAYYPDQETTFFHNLKEGDSYSVGCWINETTKVRFSN